MNARTRDMFANVSVAALPAAAVLVFGLLVPSRGPSSAKAATTPQVEARAPSAKVPVDTALAQAAAAEMTLPFAGSPMMTLVGPNLVMPEVVEEDVVPVVPTNEVRPPDFSVTAIMNARGSTVAIVNSKVRHDGDDLGDGWTITLINAADSTVVITHTSGKTATLALIKRSR